MSELKLCRDAFEYFFSDEGASPRAIERSEDGGYILSSAASAWNVWQACWYVRTQPEATKPAQDLQLVVATSTETGFFHVVIHVNDGERSMVLYDKQHSLNGDTVGVADIPAAALASPADALVAGDSAQPEANADAKDAQLFERLFDEYMTVMGSAYCQCDLNQELFEECMAAITAARQAKESGND